MDAGDRLFVYGTLRAGEAARALVAAHVARSVPGTVRGAMYAFPMGYPGLVDGDGAVRGELLWLADLDAALPLLDDYEGEDFARVERTVELEDGTRLTAWCYVLSDPSSVRAAGAVEVPGGDWIDYRAARSSC
jgi:gamma-glutamylcyclotransferase (GGCT)/AIG2-like uncharacterized protein YtfP